MYSLLVNIKVSELNKLLVLNFTGQQRQQQQQGQRQRRERGENEGEERSAQWDFQVNWDDIHNIHPKLKSRLDKGKKLTKSLRRSFVSRIVTQVRNSVPGVDRRIFIQVMADMKRKYPRTFRHELANGVVGKGTVTYFMQTKYDNDRRPKERTRLETESPAIKAAYGCVKWRLLNLPAGQTPGSQDEIRSELVEIFTTQREQAWDWEVISEKMNSTYGTLREEINRQALAIEKARKDLMKQRRQNQQNEEQNVDNPEDAITSTAELQERWPFLFQPKGMMSHFVKLTQVNFEEQMRIFLETEVDKTIEFLVSKREDNKSFKRRMDRAIRSNPANIDSLKLTGLVKMLSNYFDEDMSFIMKVIEVS